MYVSVSSVLVEPCMAAAAPIVRSGASELQRPVRWVHSSEVLDVASLLAGGELLLSGGTLLATVDEPALRGYVRALALRGVSALAIETGSHLPEIPSAMLEEAQTHCFPIIELREVVPFVSISQTVNTFLTKSSARNLQLIGDITQELTALFAEGSNPVQLLNVLAYRTQSQCELRSVSGDLIATAGTNRLQTPPESHTVTLRGGNAVLIVNPDPHAEVSLTESGLSHISSIFALALSAHPHLTSRSNRIAELISLLMDPASDDEQLADRAKAYGLAGRGPFVMLVADIVSHSNPIGFIESALPAAVRTHLYALHRENYFYLIALGGGKESRDEIVKSLRTARAADSVRVTIGPLCDSVFDVRSAMPFILRCARARVTRELRVVDSLDFAIEVLLERLDSDDAVSDFVREQLGALIDADGDQSTLFDTLQQYLSHLGNKTSTARALHVQRQSLYGRLDRIGEVLGIENMNFPQQRVMPTLLAVALESARRNQLRHGSRVPPNVTMTGAGTRPSSPRR